MSVSYNISVYALSIIHSNHWEYKGQDFIHQLKITSSLFLHRPLLVNQKKKNPGLRRFCLLQNEVKLILQDYFCLQSTIASEKH